MRRTGPSDSGLDLFEQHVGIADTDAIRIIVGADLVGFFASIAFNLKNTVAVSERCSVALKMPRQIAEDAAADLRAFGDDADGLGDNDVAIPFDRDMDVEHGDLFTRERRLGEEKRKQRKQRGAETHWSPPR